LLAESRRSKDAVKYELGEDGTILSKTIRPARGPYTPGRLTREEMLCILIQTGEVPEIFPAAAYVGVQATDHGGGHSRNPMPGGVLRQIQDQPATPENAAKSSAGLWDTGIMSGFKDDGT
jgi:hypothetical protein